MSDKRSHSHPLCALTLLMIVVPTRAIAQDRSALTDIIGVWQSDTTADGVSARSTCASSPTAGAVICEQTITTPTGTRHAVNFFLVDSAAHRYVFYGLNKPGSAIEPTPLSIADHIWVYGGQERQRDGNYYRTVNDFSSGGTYVWRQEVSPDGVHWSATRHGRVTRQASPS